MGSFLQAKNQGGNWLVRIEDVDIPRKQAGATKAILDGLDTLGLHWDGEIIYQSQRDALYRDAIDRLKQQNLTYRCACSRAAVTGKPYPGTCRNGLPAGKKGGATRVVVKSPVIEFVDGLHGVCKQDVESDVGDFIIRRADGLTSYHLAVVMDDAIQGVTEIVRGSDLLDSTPRQIYLQRLLGLPTPDYLHLPVAVDATGRKISKQNRAAAASMINPVSILFDVLEFLGQCPPHELLDATSSEVIAWGIRHWSVASIPGQKEIMVSNP